MKFSTKTRYGVRAILDLASHYEKKPVLVKDIAKRQEISERYLEHIMLDLKKAGFVQSIVGSKGGYILAKDPSEIKLSEIVEVLEGSFSPVACVENKSLCQRASICVARKIWKKVKEQIKKTLASFTLKDLIEMEKDKKEEVLMYQI